MGSLLDYMWMGNMYMNHIDIYHSPVSLDGGISVGYGE